MKKLKSFIVILLIMIIAVPKVAYAVPEKPPGSNSSPNSGSASYNGAVTFKTSTTEKEKTYSSETGSQNALLVSGGESTINSCTISKTGDSDGDNADFYGTNAAILTYNGATLNIKGGNITTNGSHANAVFAYGTGIINISDATIKTTSNNSGGIMVTGGGTLTADNLTVETDGNSSAPIRSDRGGGTLTVNKGKYTSNGIGSPVIYSTANITAKEAKLTSTASEGVVIEGKNSVTLDSVTLNATNNKLNGNSETYKAIFIYQSMSGDADVGTSSFTSKNSKIINNKGDIIYVTNTDTVINLESNGIVNNDSEGVFLRAASAKWGTSGSNGGHVTLTMTNQEATGDMVIDSISTLNLSLKDKSILIGAIDKENQAKEVKLTMSSDSILSLTADTYVDSFENEDTENKNIYSNGKYKLYVAGSEVKINSETYDSDTDSDAILTDGEEKGSNANCTYYIIGSIVLLVLVMTISITIIKKKLRKVKY